MFTKKHWLNRLILPGILLLFFSPLWFLLPTLAEKKEEITYLAFGDSLTAGIGATEINYLRINAFVPRLTAYLRQTYQVTVENHGIPGITSEQQLFYLENGPGVSRRLSEASIITLSIGGNDLLRLVSSGNLDEAAIEETIGAYRRHLNSILDNIRRVNTNAPIFVMGLYSPYPEGHPLASLGERVIPLFNSVLQQTVVNRTGVYDVQVYEQFEGKELELTLIANQDIHPNDRGYELIFDAFVLQLQQVQSNILLQE